MGFVFVCGQQPSVLIAKCVKLHKFGSNHANKCTLDHDIHSLAYLFMNPQRRHALLLHSVLSPRISAHSDLSPRISSWPGNLIVSSLVFPKLCFQSFFPIRSQTYRVCLGMFYSKRSAMSEVGRLGCVERGNCFLILKKCQ